MREQQDLVMISKYAGERFDLVQAGGGNSSVKLKNGDMLIKASGVALGVLDLDSGYVVVDTDLIKKIVSNDVIILAKDKRQRESITAKLIQEATLSNNGRPSIEVILHGLLSKYTLHTHPVVVNMIVNKKDWKEQLKIVFSEEITLIDYYTPGIELGLALQKAIKYCNTPPKIVFLQNHGLIISSDNAQEVIELTDYVTSKIEKYFGVDYSKFRLANKVSDLVNQVSSRHMLSYLSNDADIVNNVIENQQIFNHTPFAPDVLVYCGFRILRLDNISDIASLRNYQDRYFELPKVIILQDNVYILADSIRKAKEIEELLRFHVVVVARQFEQTNFIQFEELAYLSNWEAEKYRQQI